MVNHMRILNYCKSKYYYSLYKIDIPVFVITLNISQLMAEAVLWSLLYLLTPGIVQTVGTHQQILKNNEQGFPGGAVVGSLSANAGDAGSSPGLGRSHMPRSNQAREPQLLSLRVWSLCSATRVAAIVRGPHTTMKSGPCLPQLEKALTQKRRPNTAINK